MPILKSVNNEVWWIIVTRQRDTGYKKWFKPLINHLTPPLPPAAHKRVCHAEPVTANNNNLDNNMKILNLLVRWSWVIVYNILLVYVSPGCSSVLHAEPGVKTFKIEHVWLLMVRSQFFQTKIIFHTQHNHLFLSLLIDLWRLTQNNFFLLPLYSVSSWESWRKHKNILFQCQWQ